MKVYIVQYSENDYSEIITTFGKFEDALKFVEATEEQGICPKDTLFIDEFDVR